jgi:hypothetical protein
MFDVASKIENNMSFSTTSISLEDFSKISGLEEVNDYLFAKKINNSKTLLFVPKKNNCQVAMVKIN